jgi:hypothetical protein
MEMFAMACAAIHYLAAGATEADNSKKRLREGLCAAYPVPPKVGIVVIGPPLMSRAS